MVGNIIVSSNGNSYPGLVYEKIMLMFEKRQNSQVSCLIQTGFTAFGICTYMYLFTGKGQVANKDYIGAK